MFLQIDNRHFFVVHHGSGDRTFLAHSGFAGTNEGWLPTLELLSRNWRTIAYDHRGAGETVVPLEEITAEALVDDIFRILDALDVERCVLAGFSAGTVPVLNAIVQQPERFDGLGTSE
jgi:pimeloyl-ACP methyl ester carboxylesterase